VRYEMIVWIVGNTGTLQLIDAKSSYLPPHCG
jgi:hypothetical protein